MQKSNMLLTTFLSSVSMPLADEAMKLVLQYKLVGMHTAIYTRRFKSQQQNLSKNDKESVKNDNE